MSEDNNTELCMPLSCSSLNINTTVTSLLVVWDWPIFTKYNKECSGTDQERGNDYGPLRSHHHSIQWAISV